MGRNDRTDLTARIASGIAEATAHAVAFRDGWKNPPVPRDPRDRMALEHERQQRDYARETTRYRNRVARLRRRASYATATALAAGAVATADLVGSLAGGSLDAWFWLGAPAAGIAALTARTSKRTAAELPVPLPPTAPPPPPRPLPAGIVGAGESAHLHRVRVQLAQLVPTIEGLHSDAAVEIRRADFEAAPALAALVERLAVLSRVESEMAGTPAAATAAASAEEIRIRLAQGVAMYEELLNAALQMLSAPDPASAPSYRLDITVRELAAYTEGLHIAAASADFA